MKFPLTPEHLILLTGEGSPDHIISSDLTQFAFFGWNAVYYPIELVIDLRAKANVTSLNFYNDKGTKSIKLEIGDNPFAPSTVQNITITGNLKWTSIPLAASGRYVKLSLTQKANFPKVEVYGDLLEAAEPFPQPHAQVPEPLWNVGATGFQWMPAAQHPKSISRWYVDWKNHSTAKDAPYLFMIDAGGKKKLIEDVIKEYNDIGCEVMYDINRCPDWMVALQQPVFNPDTENEYKPLVPVNGVIPDPLNPASYWYFADVAFQVAARLGRTQVPTNLLKVQTSLYNNPIPVVSGLNRVKIMQCWNEANKHWKGRWGYFHPFEYCAMLSAYYDGHMGTMGTNVGVKNADPTMLVFPGGFASTNPHIYKSMILWCKFHRQNAPQGRMYCWDGISVHYYDNDGDNQTGTRTTGIVPEKSQRQNTVRALVDLRDKYLPAQPIHYGEGGYDTHIKSKQHAPTLGTYTLEESQAICNIRMALCSYDHGCDLFTIYHIRDEATQQNLASGNVANYLYSVSGLLRTSSSGGIKTYSEKPSFYYVEAMNFHLKGMRCVGFADTPDQIARVSFYESDDGKRRAYAIRVITDKAEVKPIQIPLDNATSVKRVDLNNTTTGQIIPLQVMPVLELVATEKPFLIITEVNGSTPPPPPPPPPSGKKRFDFNYDKTKIDLIVNGVKL